MTGAVLALATFLTATPQSKPAAPEAPPIAPMDARIVLHLPAPTQGLPAFRQLFTAAGTKAPLLRPVTFERLFRPALGADLFDLEALADAGIDPQHPITLSQWRGQWLACFTTRANPTPTDERGARQEPGADGAGEREVALAPLPLPMDASASGRSGAGAQSARPLKPVRFEEQGVTFRGQADDTGAWLSGRARLGSLVCSANAIGVDVRPLLRLAADSLRDANASPARAPEPQALALVGERAPLVGRFQTRHGRLTARFFPNDSGLVARGKLQGSGELLAKPEPKASQPLHQMTRSAPDVPVWLNLSLSKKALAAGGKLDQALDRALRHSCLDCPAEARLALQRRLLESLSGPVALAITGLDPRAPRGSPQQIRQAIFASVREAEQPKLKTALSAIEPRLAQSRFGVGLRGGTLSLGNDEKLLKQVSTPSETASAPPPKDAVRLTFHGARLAELLQPISMFDMANGSLFGALFFLKMEAGALIKSADKLELTANPVGPDIDFEATIALGQQKKR
ncbi:MAG: hypothetical protein LBM75_05205 [Myxococcales bacterium]|jgi:hypothetical protein|nr:hypothetical protein [Myxococcales bacterium]